MKGAACPVPAQELEAYWLGELDEAQELGLEEHLFACAACSERLRALVEIGAAIRGELRHGGVSAVLPETFVRRLKEVGLRVREYDLGPGGSVNCTVTPDDDLVVAYLKAPLKDVHRLDIVIHVVDAGTQRVNDVPFDPDAGSVAALASVPFLRTLSVAQLRYELVAVDGADERVVADYTFNHRTT
jgi:hypothetical protein